MEDCAIVQAVFNELDSEGRNRARRNRRYIESRDLCGCPAALLAAGLAEQRVQAAFRAIAIISRCNLSTSTIRRYADTQTLTLARPGTAVRKEQPTTDLLDPAKRNITGSIASREQKCKPNEARAFIQWELVEVTPIATLKQTREARDRTKTVIHCVLSGELALHTIIHHDEHSDQAAG